MRMTEAVFFIMFSCSPQLRWIICLVLTSVVVVILIVIAIIVGVVVAMNN